MQPFPGAAGVLGLPYAMSYLGWVAGTITLTLLTAASIYTSYLLAALHERGAPGRRLNDYQAMGRAVLGPRLAMWTVVPVQNVLLVGLCITYSVAAGQNLKGLLGGSCTGAACAEGIAPWIAGFAVLQLAASQLPELHSIWWVSAIGAGMSLTYTAIAGVVSCVQAAAGTGAASAGPPRQDSPAGTVFGVLNALGSMGFVFGGQGVLPEIQATLAVPPGAHATLKPMMISVVAAYAFIIAAYYSVSVGGYAAYGAAAAPDVLMSLGGPAWLRKAGNAAVVLHMAAAYQVFAQPVFALAEGRLRDARRSAGRAPAPLLPTRLAVRSLYVAAVTAVAVAVPFFAEVMGIISSLGLVPMTFVLPPVMWLVSERPRGMERLLNIGIATSCGLLALLALIGSTRNVIVQLSNR